MKSKSLPILIILVLLLVSIIPAAAAPAAFQGIADESGQAPKLDNKADPLTTKQLDMKKFALEEKLAGKAVG